MGININWPITDKVPEMTKEYPVINEFFHSTETAEVQQKINYTDYRLIIILIIVIKQTIEEINLHERESIHIITTITKESLLQTLKKTLK